MPPHIAAIFVIDFKLMRAGCTLCPILRQAALAQSWATPPTEHAGQQGVTTGENGLAIPRA
jgi:hypothetical protein